MPLHLSKLKINIKREINKMKLGNLDKAILGLKKRYFIDIKLNKGYVENM